MKEFLWFFSRTKKLRKNFRKFFCSKKSKKVKTELWLKEKIFQNKDLSQKKFFWHFFFLIFFFRFFVKKFPKKFFFSLFSPSDPIPHFFEHQNIQSKFSDEHRDFEFFCPSLRYFQKMDKNNFLSTFLIREKNFSFFFFKSQKSLSDWKETMNLPLWSTKEEL